MVECSYIMEKSKEVYGGDGIRKKVNQEVTGSNPILAINFLALFHFLTYSQSFFHCSIYYYVFFWEKIDDNRWQLYNILFLIISVKCTCIKVPVSKSSKSISLCIYNKGRQYWPQIWAELLKVDKSTLWEVLIVQLEINSYKWGRMINMGGSKCSLKLEYEWPFWDLLA